MDEKNKPAIPPEVSSLFNNRISIEYEIYSSKNDASVVQDEFWKTGVEKKQSEIAKINQELATKEYKLIDAEERLLYYQFTWRKMSEINSLFEETKCQSCATFFKESENKDLATILLDCQKFLGLTEKTKFVQSRNCHEYSPIGLQDADIRAMQRSYRGFYNEKTGWDYSWFEK